MADVGIFLLFKSVLFCCHCLRLVIVIGIITYFMFGFSAVMYPSFDTDTQQFGAWGSVVVKALRY